MTRYPSVSAITAFLAILSSACVHDVIAFSPSTTSLQIYHSPNAYSTTLLMAKGATKNKNNNGGKKRRFLQQAHPIPAPTTTTDTTSAVSAKPQRNANSNSSNNNNSKPKQMVNGNAGPNSTSSSSNSKPKQQRRGPPLQTSKSIEELESILENRWGTADTAGAGKSKSGSSNGKNEDGDFVLSFGNDDDDDYLDDSRSSSGGGAGAGGSLKGAAVFRANRVLDPWAKEEGLFDSPTPKSDSSHDDETNNNSDQKHVVGKKGKKKKGKSKLFNRQEQMLHRVRSNQERIQSERKQIKGEDYYNVPIDVSRDYYDEDDEGYEGSSGGGGSGRSTNGGSGGRSSTRGNKSSLISPEPVGGKGSFAAANKKSPSSSSSSASGLSGGIFSDRLESSRDGSRSKSRQNDIVEEEKPQRKKRKEPKLNPLYDEEGNEMYLTLEQADKIVQTILSSDAPSDDDDDEQSTWQDIGITDTTLLSNLQSSQMSCPTPLPVQDKSCPSIVSGNDVLISTHTGSGKTLAFLAPIAQSLLMNTNNNNNNNNNSNVKVVVIAPGRELASQIVSVAQTLFEGTGLKVSMAIGGTPYSRNVEKLRKRKPDLVVGTPGRIAELIIGRPGDKGGKLKVSGLQTIVLDEFDALLQYDAHKEPTMAIMDVIHRQHGQDLQRVLCSATAADMMKSSSSPEKKPKQPNLIEEYLKPGYAHANVDDSDLLVTSGVQTKGGGSVTTTSARVSKTTIHGALHVPHQRLALEAVRKILNTNPAPQQALIFVDSPRRVDIVIEKLRNMDIIAAPLAGGSSNTKGDRAQVNKALREGYVGIVVATEMAARGIDAPYLTHVINLDLPTDASHYAHRAGRCGRGGRPGVAVSITTDVREKGVPHRFAEELGIDMYNVEARESKLRIVQG